jgi:L-lactate dehydrogenase complex protein LldG
MQNNSSREEILQRIAAANKKRLAFVNTTPSNTETIYKSIQPDAVSCFKNELESVSGHCILCEDEADMYAKLKNYVLEQNFPYLFCRDINISKCLKKNDIAYSNQETDFNGMKAGITACEFLVARTGSVMISAFQSGRQMNVFPPVHIVMAHVSQLVDYPGDALISIQKKYGQNLPSIISTITGPSRTADIEKTLVLGAHGPKEIVVFLSKV